MELPCWGGADRGEGLSHHRALISEPLSTILDTVRPRGHGSPPRTGRTASVAWTINSPGLPASASAGPAGREVLRAGEERMGGDGYADVVDRIEQLPGGVQPVEEPSVAVHRRILQDLRQEGTPDR